MNGLRFSHFLLGGLLLLGRGVSARPANASLGIHSKEPLLKSADIPPPALKFPDDSSYVDSASAFFRWDPASPSISESVKYNLRIEENEAPNTIVYDGNLDLNSQYPVGTLVKGLKTGREYRWRVRIVTSSISGSFSPPRLVRTLGVSLNGQLCHRLNAIGPSRFWQYRHHYFRRTWQNGQRKFADDYFKVYTYQAENVRNSGDSLLFTLQSSVSDQAASKSDSLLYRGCALNMRNTASQAWSPVVYGNKPYPGTGGSDPIGVFLEVGWGRSGREYPVGSSTTLVERIEYRWKRYRNNTLLEIGVEVGAPETFFAGTAVYKKFRILEGIGLIYSHDFKWSRGAHGSDTTAVTVDLTKVDDWDFDPSKLESTLEPVSIGIDPRPDSPLPGPIFSLRQLRAESGWNRARLFDLQGRLHSVFTPARLNEAGIPQGVYLLEVTRPEGRRQYRIAH